MPFPLSARGTIILESSDNRSLEQVAAAIDAAIRKEKPISIERKGNYIGFNAGVFRFVHNWNQLAAITTGELHFSKTGGIIEIHYRISFTQLLILVTSTVSLMLGCILLFVGRHEIPLRFLALAWLWLFGGNYVFTLVRFPRFLRSAARAQAPSHPLPQSA